MKERRSVQGWLFGILLLGVTHLAISYRLFGVLYAWGMASPPPRGPYVVTTRVVAWVLLFPLDLVGLLDQWLRAPETAYTRGFVVNSLLWSAGFIWLLTWILRWKRKWHTAT